MPILKQLVAGSQTKRRSRMDLTTEMISAPLGDFRHTMHVGRSGEAFGDTSFLSTRSGEPPQEGHTYPRSPKPGLLSRTFRSSKRSQSVTRVDQRDNTLLPPSGSPAFVKNAMSLPFLNNEEGQGGDGRVLKSLTSSPSNGASADALDLELHEKHFGVLTDLRPSPTYNGGGLRKAESVMSFHVDLGPSMLGEILGVMEKEDDDQGFEEGKSSEGHASPLPCIQGGVEIDEEMTEVIMKEEEPEELVAQDESQLRASSSVDLEIQSEGTSTPEPHHKHLHQFDSCSVSSSSSAAVEEKPISEPYEEDIEITENACKPVNEPAFSSFMEDEDDEIRV
ncbi:cdc42 effector protein 4a isoform X1 [Danio rerio]|uniref:CDC42 effector protein (Rho GTPase binding) 4 n=4 Tax=Danio rerio TaxID=7955 RepID=Q6GMK1_DANRE|nr:cdc42 effector protein 4a [Danio rerio]XP_005164499.1 CDC42 effector protein (Rho GTPase binding) 4a isoform X1 [Danio rerio]XP_021325857.1 CDC42 effector protein (Rho GTPase binding) 4a isoform X1 [Danio rerio]AAH74044.1 CDC42 effector protein (Rho GTPase binding) 4 [Danio rerio]|eukprot:NP_001002183.1 CDC42 effector protein (Rho GTPase binding) 4a [Danio rerio]